MSSVLRRRNDARFRGERGAVAVEAALVTPILVMLVLGIVEFSLLLRDYVAVSSSVRVGARIASANPGLGPATCTPAPCTPPTAPAFAQVAANAIQRAGTAMPKDSIDYIIVYQANKNGYPAPTGTATTNIPSNTATALPAAGTTSPCASFANCTAYKWVDASDSFAYAAPGSWSSASVDACPTTAYGLGVYMHATHRNITSFFGGTFGISDRTVMNFEPLSPTMCNPSSTSPHP